MEFSAKLKDALTNRLAEGIWAGLLAALGWALYQIVPLVLPVLEEKLPLRVLFAVLGVSVAANLILGFLLRQATARPALRLKYGIYWDQDKNPHCPACKIPVGAYGAYGEYSADTGYYCKPCGKIFPLADAHGRDISPSKAQAEL